MVVHDHYITLSREKIHSHRIISVHFTDISQIHNEYFNTKSFCVENCARYAMENKQKCQMCTFQVLFYHQQRQNKHSPTILDSTIARHRQNGFHSICATQSRFIQRSNSNTNKFKLKFNDLPLLNGLNRLCCQSNMRTVHFVMILNCRARVLHI